MIFFKKYIKIKFFFLSYNFTNNPEQFFYLKKKKEIMFFKTPVLTSMTYESTIILFNISEHKTTKYPLQFLLLKQVSHL